MHRFLRCVVVQAAAVTRDRGAGGQPARQTRPPYSAVHARTKAINQLKATLVTAAPALRETLSGLGAKTLVRRCSTLADSAQDSVSQRATVYVLRGLGQRILALTAEADQTEKHMNGLLQQHASSLIARTGISPDSAAALLIVAGDNHDRIRTEASFAALCGVSPVEASSGNTRRRRLNRGGDRRANAALYRIALSRLSWDPRTQAYMTRRLAEGRTRREVVRCLKRLGLFRCRPRRIGRRERTASSAHRQSVANKLACLSAAAFTPGTSPAMIASTSSTWVWTRICRQLAADEGSSSSRVAPTACSRTSWVIDR